MQIVGVIERQAEMTQRSRHEQHELLRRMNQMTAREALYSNSQS